MRYARLQWIFTCIALLPMVQDTMPCYSPPDTEYYRIEAQVVASIFNVLNQLQDAGYDPSQTITTFLANLAADQPNPLNVLHRLFVMAREKTIAIRETERTGKPVRPLPPPP